MRFTAFEVTIVDDDGSHLFRPDLNKDVSKGIYIKRENADKAAAECGGMVFPITENWHFEYPFEDRAEHLDAMAEAFAKECAGSCD